MKLWVPPHSLFMLSLAVVSFDDGPDDKLNVSCVAVAEYHKLESDQMI